MYNSIRIASRLMWRGIHVLAIGLAFWVILWNYCFAFPEPIDFHVHGHEVEVLERMVEEKEMHERRERIQEGTASDKDRECQAQFDEKNSN